MRPNTHDLAMEALVSATLHPARLSESDRCSVVTLAQRERITHHDLLHARLLTFIGADWSEGVSLAGLR
jgi:hypothetical protein